MHTLVTQKQGCRNWHRNAFAYCFAAGTYVHFQIQIWQEKDTWSWGI